MLDPENFITLYYSSGDFYKVCNWCEMKFLIGELYGPLLTCTECGAVQYNPIGATKLNIVVEDECNDDSDDEWEIL